VLVITAEQKTENNAAQPTEDILDTPYIHQLWDMLHWPVPAHHPDVLIMNPDRTALKIADVRALQHHLLMPPLEQPRRLIVLCDIDRTTLPAQQALLKSIEEPPSHVALCLTAEYLSRVLPTIQSRCLILHSYHNHDATVDTARRSGSDGNLSSNARDILASPAHALTFAAAWSAQYASAPEEARTALFSALTQSVAAAEQAPTPHTLALVRVWQHVGQWAQHNVNIKTTLEAALLREIAVVQKEKNLI
jgi:hypothetical protein